MFLSSVTNHTGIRDCRCNSKTVAQVACYVIIIKEVFLFYENFNFMNSLHVYNINIIQLLIDIPAIYLWYTCDDVWNSSNKKSLYIYMYTDKIPTISINKRLFYNRWLDRRDPCWLTGIPRVGCVSRPMNECRYDLRVKSTSASWPCWTDRRRIVPKARNDLETFGSKIIWYVSIYSVIKSVFDNSIKSIHPLLKTGLKT